MKASRPYLLGLTGGIASGKSHVSRKLSELGCPVIDADSISRALTSDGGPALPSIRRLFGDAVFYEDGALNRAALGALVFADQERLSALNGLLHPMVFEEINSLLEKMSDAPLVVLEVPLLYETGADKSCDEVWTVFVPYQEQLRRLMRRNGLSEQEAARRIASQMPGLERNRLADRVIDASGPYPETEAQVIAYLNDLKRRLHLD